MTTQAVDALVTIHADVRTVLSALTDADWSASSACEGWRVQDVFAHVTSNLKEVADPSPPPEGEAPAMKAEEAMEALVAPRRDWTPAQLLAEYDQHYPGWLGAMQALQEEPAASATAPLADLGTHPMHMLANAFAFDHYCHLRIDLLAPSGPLSVDLPPVTDDQLRPGIDWMIAGLPQMQPEEMRVVTQPLGLSLTGPGGGEWTIWPAEGDGFITITEGADDRTVATVSSSAHDFVSWGTCRSSWRESCVVSGDEDYAATVLDAINII
jgi:uncharacterized protein (TIGR03083 family)